MFPHQSESTRIKVHGVSSQPKDLNPVATTSSNHRPLQALKDVEHLFLEETARTSQAIDYSIINEAGQALLYAHVTYCFFTFQHFICSDTRLTHKLIREIKVLDATGHIVANTSVIVGTEARCGLECSLNDFTIDINGQTWGELDFDKSSCDCPNEYHLRSVIGTFDCKFGSKHEYCCFSAPLCCCTCCPNPFEIYDSVSRELLGQMHTNWSSHPGKFGLTFPNSMRIELKVLLLVVGIYLNAQYFEDHTCCRYCGHVGLLGKVCYVRWFAAILMILIICSIPVIIWWTINN